MINNGIITKYLFETSNKHGKCELVEYYMPYTKSYETPQHEVYYRGFRITQTNTGYDGLVSYITGVWDGKAASDRRARRFAGSVKEYLLYLDQHWQINASLKFVMSKIDKFWISNERVGCNLQFEENKKRDRNVRK